MNSYDTTEGFLPDPNYNTQFLGVFDNDVRDTTSNPELKVFPIDYQQQDNLTDGTLMTEEKISSSRISPTFRLIQQLDHLSEISHVDAEHLPISSWPKKEAFADARMFVLKLPLAVISLPEIRVADDGEINFLWSREDCHVDLGFYGTGTYSYFGRDLQGKEIMDEGNLATSGLADPIIKLLSA